MTKPAETRARIVAATNELFRRKGYNGTSISDVRNASRATTGSLYHFFGGGKADLAEAVLVESGAVYRELFTMIAAASADAISAITDFFDGAALVLEETDYIDPCPIGTVAREVASTDDRLRTAANSVFESWIDAVAEEFVVAGIDRRQAADLAASVVAALEGGFILARTGRDADILRSIGRQMGAVVAATVAQPSGAVVTEG